MENSRRLVIAVVACAVREGHHRTCAVGVCVRTCSALDIHRTYDLPVSRAQSNQFTCFGMSESVRSPNTWLWLAPLFPIEDFSVAPVGLMRAMLVVVTAVIVLSCY